MNKQDLVDAVAKRLGVTKARANEIAELFFSAGGLIATELRRGGKVAVSGFGSFETRGSGRRARGGIRGPARRSTSRPRRCRRSGRPRRSGIW